MPVIDARKERVYASFYHGGERSGDMMDVNPRELYELLPAERVLATGPFARQLLDLPPFAGSSHLELDASSRNSPLHALVELGVRQLEGSGADAEARGPLYIRRSEAEESRTDSPARGGE
jgi:tRNA A37 threonylcarbamoyladenosine modification protein TsaB